MIDRFNLLFFAFLLLLIVLQPALAQVSVSEVIVDSGEPTQFTVKGSGFDNGPYVVLFDNFSKTSGAEITPDSPVIGNWFELGDGATKGNEGVAFSGGQSAKVLDTNSPYGHFKMVFGIKDSAQPNGLALFDEVYLSYAVRDLGAFPGPGGTATSFSNQSSTKDAWLMLGDRGDRGKHELADPWKGNDIYIPAWTGDKFFLHGNSTGLKFWQNELTEDWVFGGWNQMFFYAKIDPANPFDDGRGFFGYANTNNFKIKYRAGAFMTFKQKKPHWDRVKFTPWFRYGENRAVRLMDEIYIAIGDNAAARVMVGDAAKISNVTRLHHALPTAWNPNEIAVDLGALGLDTEKAWYVYVFNSANEFNTQGMALAFD